MLHWRGVVDTPGVEVGPTNYLSTTILSTYLPKFIRKVFWAPMITSSMIVLGAPSLLQYQSLSYLN